MRKILEFAVMMLVIGLVGCGTIHVGNVPFSSKEVCSAEYSDWYRPNSSCLPPTRTANVQSYYYEKKRLPISHKEARDIDDAAIKQDAAYAQTPLMQAVSNAARLRAMLENFNERLDNLANKKSWEINNPQSAPEIGDMADLQDKLAKIKEQLGNQSGISEAKLITAALKKVEAVPEEVAKHHRALLQKMDTLNGFPEALANLVAQSTVQSASSVIGEQYGQMGEAISTVSANASSVAEFMDKWQTFAASSITPPPVSLEAFLEDMQSKKNALEEKANQYFPTDEIRLKAAQKLGLAHANLEQMKYEGEKIAEILNSSGLNPSEMVRQLKSGESALKTTKELLSRETPKVTLGGAAEMLFGLLHTDRIVGRHGNLLPSLIGRVFTAKVMPSTPYPDGLFRVPGHEGNLELLPASGVGKTLLNEINTEVLVNSDISGIVRKQMNVSASFDATQLMAKVPTPSVAKNQNLQAIMGAALASLDTGTGSYYYVSMTDEKLDSLVSKIHQHGCMANIPPDRADTQLLDEPPYANSTVTAGNANKNGCELNKLARELAADGIAISDPSYLKNAAGMGIITGVAVLRTRKGTSEVCSSIGAGIAPGKKAGVASKPGADVCGELKNILQGHGVPRLEIDATLASLNAAYRSESYKTLLIHDHASVLALHWIPIKLKNIK